MKAIIVSFLSFLVIFDALCATMFPVRAKSSLLVNRFYSPLQTPGLMDSIIQWQTYNLLTCGPKDVVLIGDSSCLMGLSPDVIEGDTGLSVVNLAMVKHIGIPGIKEVLRVYCEKWGPPKVVILHISHDLPQKDGEQLAIKRQFIKNFIGWLQDVTGEGGQLLSWKKMPPKRTVNCVNSLVWEIRKHPSLDQPRAVFAEPKTPVEAKLFYPSDNDVRDYMINSSGFFPCVDIPVLSEPMEIDFSLSQKFSDDVDSLIEFVVNRGAKVVFVMQPVPERARGESTDSAYAAMAERFAEYIGSPFAPYLPNEFFADPKHLSSKGVASNSHRVSDLITSALEQ